MYHLKCIQRKETAYIFPKFWENITHRKNTNGLMIHTIQPRVAGKMGICFPEYWRGSGRVKTCADHVVGYVLPKQANVQTIFNWNGYKHQSQYHIFFYISNRHFKINLDEGCSC